MLKKCPTKVRENKRRYKLINEEREVERRECVCVFVCVGERESSCLKLGEEVKIKGKIICLS